MIKEAKSWQVVVTIAVVLCSGKRCSFFVYPAMITHQFYVPH